MMYIWRTSIIFTFTGVLMVFSGLASGQSVTLSVDPVVERGEDTRFTCTGGTSPYAFVWTDQSRNPNVIIYTAGEKSPEPKYSDFTLLENGDTSTMTIMNTRIEDEGRYSCSEGIESDVAEFTVEVQATLSLSVTNPLRNGNMYNATCDAVNGRPEVTTSITWMIGDVTLPCSSTGEEDLPADTDLFSKRSWCTFQALSEYNNETLRCIISGHQLISLNGEETTTLNVERAPSSTGIMTVGFHFQDPNLRVSCDIDAADQPNPSIRNYYITSNDTLIHQSTMGVNSVVVVPPNFGTDFLCVAGNYLGNTTSPVATYDPDRTTTPPFVTTGTTTPPFVTTGTTTPSFVTTGTTTPPTITTVLTNPEPIITEETTSEPRSEEPFPTSCDCLSSGASAGIAVLAILLAGSIIINVIQFIMWRRNATRSDKNGSQKVTSSDVRGGSREANDNMAYEMIQSGDRAYTALKLSSSGTSRSASIDPDNVTFFTRLGSIGRGDFGAVWKGELRSNQGRAAVAIRQIPDHVSKSSNVLQAVKVLCGLPDQPNVVKCIGFCQEQSSIIYEFISGGTLLTHLQTTGVQSQPTYSNLKPNRVRIDEGSLLNFAWQIAKGMQFLASKKIIHGTLCAHNVLLGERNQCKLSDNGLASSLFNNGGKPTRWSSPETMVTGVQSTEGDIWSFGIVLWEIVTLGARPYPNMTFDTVQKEVSNGYKMPRPRHCGQQLYTIMSGCWEIEGRNRIRFDEILKTLERILEKTHDYLSLNDLDKDVYASPLDV